jgi:hypothetical protein
MESNWTEVFLAGSQPCLRKTDGSVWTTWRSGGKNQQTNELEPGFSIQRVSYFEHGKWRGTTKIWRGLDYQLIINADGTFRIRADEKFNKQSRSYELAETDLQFGKSTNWLGVAGHGEKVVTLKDDGTLWLWNFHYDFRHGWHPERDEREMLEVKPVRLGTHADWIAITSAQGGIVSLAADGSLWYWPLDSLEYIRQFGSMFYDNTYLSFEPLLDISRKPQFLGNVFGNVFGKEE